MNTGTSHYRKKARIVAIIDLVLTSMSIWLPMGLVLAANNPKIENELVKDMKITTEDFDSVVWIVIVVSTLTIIVQMIAAVKLVNATQIGKSPVEAAKLARFWRCVTIFFQVLSFLNIIRQAEAGFCLGFTFTSIFIRGVALYIVHKFIVKCELTAFQTLFSHARPTIRVMNIVLSTPGDTSATPTDDSAPPKYEDTVQPPKQ